jgi:excisionase family DNA binding protein
MNGIITPRELADVLRCSDATIRTMAQRGEIPGAFRVGKLWRFHADTALAHLAPRTDTLFVACHVDQDQSALANAQPAAAGSVSAGAKPVASAKNAGTPPRMRRKTVQHRSEHAFARVFPANQPR